MSLKAKFVSAAVSLTIAAGVIAGAAQPSVAGGLSRGEAAALAGIGGFILGATVARPYDGGYRYHEPRVSSWDRHVQRCYDRYRTYNHHTDTYIGYDGYEHYCRL